MPRHRYLARSASCLLVMLVALGLLGSARPAAATENVVLGELFSRDG